MYEIMYEICHSHVRNFVHDFVRDFAHLSLYFSMIPADVEIKEEPASPTPRQLFPIFFTDDEAIGVSSDDDFEVVMTRKNKRKMKKSQAISGLHVSTTKLHYCNCKL